MGGTGSRPRHHDDDMKRVHTRLQNMRETTDMYEERIRRVKNAKSIKDMRVLLADSNTSLAREMIQDASNIEYARAGLAAFRQKTTQRHGILLQCIDMAWKLLDAYERQLLSYAKSVYISLTLVPMMTLQIATFLTAISGLFKTTIIAMNSSGNAIDARTVAAMEPFMAAVNEATNNFRRCMNQTRTVPTATSGSRSAIKNADQKSKRVQWAS